MFIWIYRNKNSVNFVLKKEKHLSLVMVKFALQTHLIIFALCQQDFCDTKWPIPIFKTGFTAYWDRFPNQTKYTQRHTNFNEYKKQKVIN